MAISYCSRCKAKIKLLDHCKVHVLPTLRPLAVIKLHVTLLLERNVKVPYNTCNNHFQLFHSQCSSSTSMSPVSKRNPYPLGSPCSLLYYTLDLTTAAAG